jgi:hypothetical protein
LVANKQLIMNINTAITGYHHKYAIRFLRVFPSSKEMEKGWLAKNLSYRNGAGFDSHLGDLRSDLP